MRGVSTFLPAIPLLLTLQETLTINVGVIKLSGDNRIAKQNEYILAAMSILRWWEDVPGGEARVIVGRKNIGTEIYKDVFGKKRRICQLYSYKVILLAFFSPHLQVNINFSEEQGLPGSNISLYLEAAPDSFCALRAVDKSVLLLKSEEELSADSVSSLISPLLSKLLQVSPFRWHFWNGTCWKIKYSLPLFLHGLYT